MRTEPIIMQWKKLLHTQSYNPSKELNKTRLSSQTLKRTQTTRSSRSSPNETSMDLFLTKLILSLEIVKWRQEMENLTSKTRSRVPLILITEGLFTHCPIEPRLIMMMLIRLLDCLRVVGLLSELRLMSLGLSQWKVGMWRIGKREISKDVEKNGKPQGRH